MADTFLTLYEDHARGLALVRGNRGVRDVLELAHLDGTARYSTAGKGWVLGVEHVADLVAVAEHHGVRVRVKAVTP